MITRMRRDLSYMYTAYLPLSILKFTKESHLSLSTPHPIVPVLHNSFNIILPNTPRSSKRCSVFPSGFPHQTVSTWLLSHTRHMPHPSHLPWYYHQINFWRQIKGTKPLDIQFSPASRCFLQFRTKRITYPPSSFRTTSALCSSQRETKFHTHIKQLAKLQSHISEPK
jgi:hypothetical protein